MLNRLGKGREKGLPRGRKKQQAKKIQLLYHSTKGFWEAVTQGLYSVFTDEGLKLKEIKGVLEIIVVFLHPC